MKENHSLPTSEEIDRRLRIADELRNLCLSLGRAKPAERPLTGSESAFAVEAEEMLFPGSSDVQAPK